MVGKFSEVGEAIRTARVGKRLSQLQLAQELGLTQRTISHAESGRDLRLATLVEIARALDLEPLLVPRSLVPAINAIVGDSNRPATAAFAADADERYNEDVAHADLKPGNVILRGSLDAVHLDRNGRVVTRRRDDATRKLDSTTSDRDA